MNNQIVKIQKSNAKRPGHSIHSQITKQTPIQTNWVTQDNFEKNNPKTQQTTFLSIHFLGSTHVKRCENPSLGEVVVQRQSHPSRDSPQILAMISFAEQSEGELLKTQNIDISRCAVRIHVDLTRRCHMRHTSPLNS